MKNENKIKGNIGELNVCKYLKSKKYKILETNFTLPYGEIDIIAQIKKTIVFIEVKKRETISFGYPSESVNFKKQNKIRIVAEKYLVKNNLYEKFSCRFDVIEIVGDEIINHIENAF